MPILGTPRQEAGVYRPASARWPVPDVDAIDKIVQQGGTLADLWESSSLRLESNEAVTEKVIDSLFPGNPLLCCGWDFRRCQTQLRETWRGKLSEMQFIVPSPMKALKGKTVEGRSSSRSLENTGPRRFLVVEFDFQKCKSPYRELLERHPKLEAVDLCAGLLLSLGGIVPLALVVHSGGKSLHGWFYCARQPESKIRELMRYAASLGADPATWTACQLVRMPDAMRENGRRQKVYFLNPGVVRL